MWSSFLHEPVKLWSCYLNGVFQSKVTPVLMFLHHHPLRDCVCDPSAVFYTTNPLLYTTSCPDDSLLGNSLEREVQSRSIDFDVDFVKTQHGTSPVDITDSPLPFIASSPSVDVNDSVLVSTAETLDGGLQQRQRHLLDQLDLEPVLAYLVQNGGVRAGEVASLRSGDALWRHLQASGGSGLLVNALRQTGQHQLASLLDDSQRISAHRRSGYLSKTRARGQIAMTIEVTAVKLPRNSSLRRHQVSSKSDWLSVAELAAQIESLSDERSMLAAPSGEKKPNRSSCCFCGCLSALFRRRRQRHKEESTSDATGHQGAQMQANLSATPLIASRWAALRTDEKKSDQPHDDKAVLAGLRRTASSLRRRCQTLYTAISQPCVSLLKYFEQTRSILVLSTDHEQTEDGIVVTTICMKREQVCALESDETNGRLDADLTAAIVTPERLAAMGVDAVRLQARVNRDDLQLALQEFDGA